MDPFYCQSHDDCICTDLEGCFLGNKEYFEKCVNKERGCLDYCAGWGQPPVKCFYNQCTNDYPKKDWDWTFEDCEKEVPEEHIARCQAIIAGSVAKNSLEKALNKCQELNSDICYYNIADVIAENNINQAEELCGQAGGYNNNCYKDIAIKISSLGETEVERAIAICNKITIQGTKEVCYQMISPGIAKFKSKDFAIEYCHNKIISDQWRNACYRRIAEKLKDRSICDKITIDDDITTCKNVVGREN